MAIRLLNTTTYAIRLDESGEDVEIGDAKAPEFRPHVRLKRWGDECSLAVGLAAEGGHLSIDTDRFTWDGDGIAVEMYPLRPGVVVVDTPWGEHEFRQCELGGFEFNIILKAKPLDNKLVLPIEAKGLRFYYQPPLHPDHPTWCEEPDGGYSACPENVVGSYAVYHATRGNVHRSKSDGEKYKAGKAFHIYRPRIVDAAGNAVWGDLNIDESAGLMVVEIPWAFLDSAVYPVRHAAGATFGYETLGGTSWSWNGNIIQYKATCGENGTATKLTAIGYTSTSAEMGAAIYTETGSKIAEDNGNVNLTWGYVWHDLEIDATLTANTVYRLCTMASNPTATRRTRYDAHSEANYTAAVHSDATFEDWPTTINWESESKRHVSIYCTYTPSGPPAAGRSQGHIMG